MPMVTGKLNDSLWILSYNFLNTPWKTFGTIVSVKSECGSR